MPNNYPADLVRQFRSKIVYLDLEIRMAMIELLNLRQTGDFANAIKIRVILRCIGNNDPSPTTQSLVHIIRSGPNNRSMRDQALAVIRVRFPKVPNKIGLKDDRLAGTDQPSQGIPVGGPEMLRVQSEQPQTLSNRPIDSTLSAISRDIRKRILRKLTARRKWRYGIVMIRSPCHSHDPSRIHQVSYRRITNVHLQLHLSRPKPEEK